MKRGTVYQKVLSWLRRTRIRHRLLCVFLLVSLVPVLCVGLYAYQVYTDSIYTTLSDSTRQAMFLLNQNLLSEIGKFQEYLNIISVSATVQNMLAAPPGDTYRISRENVQEIAQLLHTIPFQSIYLKNLRFIDRNHNIVYDLGYDDIPPERYEQMIRAIDLASPRDSVQYIRTYRSSDKLVIGRKIYSVNFNGEHVGYLTIYLDEKLLSNTLFTNVSFGEGSNVVLADGEGRLLSSQNRELLGSGETLQDGLMAVIRQGKDNRQPAFLTKISGVNYLVISYYNGSLDSYLVATIPYSNVTQGTMRINLTLVAISCVLIAFCLLATLMVYGSIMQPINSMVSVCNLTRGSDMEHRVADDSPDELGYLAGSLNHMMEENRLFSLRRQQDQLAQRKLELEMLQYQINPHFLFNTLNSLQFVARMNEVPALEKGLSALAALLQNTLVRNQEVIPVCEEVENLTNYFVIQSIRYAGMFDVVYDLEQEALHCEALHFILQPLAENAVIHGTRGMKKPILITVSARCCGDDLRLSIQDTGCGFAAPAAMAGGGERFSGIGLNNVDQRVRLHYGGAYGLSIDSAPGRGTCCTLVLPRREWKEEKP